MSGHPPGPGSDSVSKPSALRTLRGRPASARRGARLTGRGGPGLVNARSPGATRAASTAAAAVGALVRTLVEPTGRSDTLLRGSGGHEISGSSPKSVRDLINR